MQERQFLASVIQERRPAALATGRQRTQLLLLAASLRRVVRRRALSASGETALGDLAVARLCRRTLNASCGLGRHRGAALRTLRLLIRHNDLLRRSRRAHKARPTPAHCWTRLRWRMSGQRARARTCARRTRSSWTSVEDQRDAATERSPRVWPLGGCSAMPAGVRGARCLCHNE